VALVLHVDGGGGASRGVCHVANIVQPKLWIALAEGDAVNQVYNVAVGDRSTLPALYGMMNGLLSGNFAYVAANVLDHVDARSGDVRHAQTGLSRAAMLSGYVPTHRIDSGMREAMDGYVHDLPH
jgi:UDP-N-acetylglucosamine 4-epimerase